MSNFGVGRWSQLPGEAGGEETGERKKGRGSSDQKVRKNNGEEMEVVVSRVEESDNRQKDGEEEARGKIRFRSL